MDNAHCFGVYASFISASLSAACAVESQADQAQLDVQSDALRALRPGELQGALNFGETKTVQYSAANYFSVYSVSVNAGDVLRLSAVGTGSLKPMLWVTNKTAASTNLASAVPTASTTTLNYPATSAGTLYVVLRDANLATGRFKRSLAARAGVPSCDPDNEECGAPMTVAQARAKLIAAGNGTQQIPLGAYQYLIGYLGSCNPVTGCTPWYESGRNSINTAGSTLGVESNTVTLNVVYNFGVGPHPYGRPYVPRGSAASIVAMPSGSSGSFASCGGLSDVMASNFDVTLGPNCIDIVNVNASKDRAFVTRWRW